MAFNLSVQIFARDDDASETHCCTVTVCDIKITDYVFHFKHLATRYVRQHVTESLARDNVDRRVVDVGQFYHCAECFSELKFGDQTLDLHKTLGDYHIQPDNTVTLYRANTPCRHPPRHSPYRLCTRPSPKTLVVDWFKSWTRRFNEQPPVANKPQRSLEVVPGSLIAQNLLQDPDIFAWEPHPIRSFRIRVVSFEQFRFLPDEGPLIPPLLVLQTTTAVGILEQSGTPGAGAPPDAEALGRLG
ncbi:hypothetical protein B0H63DRAFT_445209 [Podospora didyma]|uniref:Ubiquitin-like domain-containing protein n=1 Tax=Podospora didyma TaxID=330526 RepID=A0AAE0P8T3_9PEZI|nr:hypothetical protein B0H63DRAFT_445209 [Podospora didyma]